MRIVLIDTCIWVPFFNRPQSPEKKAVDALLDEDRGALIGPIVAEILPVSYTHLDVYKRQGESAGGGG